MQAQLRQHEKCRIQVSRQVVDVEEAVLVDIDVDAVVVEESMAELAELAESQLVVDRRRSCERGGPGSEQRELAHRRFEVSRKPEKLAPAIVGSRAEALEEKKDGCKSQRGSGQHRH